MAQVDVTPLSQDELTSILYGNSDSVLIPEEGEKTPEKVEVKEQEEKRFKQPIDTNFDWNELDNLDKDKEKEELTETKVVPLKKDETVEVKEEKKVGRKTTDLVAITSELVEEGILFNFVDGPPKTNDEAKELIKLNLSEKEKGSEDQWWEKKVSNYSPQVQAILDYAEKGGSNISPLLNAISEVERTGEFDIEKESDQEAIIQEYLKVSGWDESDIKEEIETSKDLGKIKAKAEKFLPKLNQMKQERIQLIMEEQADRDAQAQEAKREYLKTLKANLDKPKVGEVKLEKGERALLWDSLTNIKYTSWNGQPTNAFFKKLEEMQMSKDGNYEHFLELVHLAVDRETFIKKIREEIKTQEASSTARKLKIEQTKKASSEAAAEDEPKSDNKNTIRRAFKNPYS
jgi:hypothetical protein